VKGDPGTGRGCGIRAGRAKARPCLDCSLAPRVDKTFKPDAAAAQLTDGLTPASVSDPPLGHFPYLGVPYSGFSNPS